MRVAFTKVTQLAPEMFTWLSARYLEHRSVTGIVDGFERFLASRGLAPIPDPPSPPAIVFVDLTGFTRLTRERGDESAVAAATSLQRTGRRSRDPPRRASREAPRRRSDAAPHRRQRRRRRRPRPRGDDGRRGCPLTARRRPHRARDRARPRRLRADREPGVPDRGRGGARRGARERSGRRGSRRRRPSGSSGSRTRNSRGFRARSRCSASRGTGPPPESAKRTGLPAPGLECVPEGS